MPRFDHNWRIDARVHGHECGAALLLPVARDEPVAWDSKSQAFTFERIIAAEHVVNAI